ncbi:hypothetical protein P7C70_g8345, partial [Phenoliferia sp. Uapishka_3]
MSAASSHSIAKDPSNSGSAGKDTSEDSDEDFHVKQLVGGDSGAYNPTPSAPVQPTEVADEGEVKMQDREGNEIIASSDSQDNALHPMPQVGERYPTVDAVRVAGSYASHRLGYRLALYSHPLRRADGSFPPFQLVCNHARHLLSKTPQTLCPARILCNATGDGEWRVDKAEYKHTHPPKFGLPWKPPVSTGQPKQKPPVVVPPTAAKMLVRSRSTPTKNKDEEMSQSEAPQAMDVDQLAAEPKPVIPAEGDESLPKVETGNQNWGSDELQPIPAVGTTYPSRDALQQAVFRAFHQRGFHVTVFQSPVLGTKRLLGLGCSRKSKPFCPFRLFAGPVDVGSITGAFTIVEVTSSHNHPARDQGPWVPRKSKLTKKKRKSSSGDNASKDGSPDDLEGYEDEQMEDVRYSVKPSPKKARRVSTAESSPAPSTTGSEARLQQTASVKPGLLETRPVNRWDASQSSSQLQPQPGAPPLYYFDQPAPRAQPPPLPIQSIPASTTSSYQHASSANNMSYSNALAEWTAFLNRLEPSLVHIATKLAAPSLGCTPSAFFAEGADDEMRMKLLERVEGIALWPRMMLMERVARIGVSTWNDMGKRADGS